MDIFRNIFKISLFFVLLCPSLSFGYEFGVNLKFGMSQSDVLLLQRALNTDTDTIVSSSGNGSSGFETNFFGVKTLDAVKRFQEKYRDEVLSPAGLSAPTGFVGPLTRKKLSLIYINTDGVSLDGNTQILEQAPLTTSKTIYDRSELNKILYPTYNIKSRSDTSDRPFIASITPTTGKNGTEVTITGTNFDLVSNTILVSQENPNTYTNIFSPDGKTITFPLRMAMVERFQKTLNSLPSSGQEKVKTQVPRLFEVTLMVRNSLGSSNEVKFNMELY
jgi:peptidoglycan hydrolase-like protein with peptidoglycan-binding domain